VPSVRSLRLQVLFVSAYNVACFIITQVQKLFDQCHYIIVGNQTIIGDVNLTGLFFVALSRSYRRAGSNLTQHVMLTCQVNMRDH